MNKPHAFPEADEPSGRFAPNESSLDAYEGVDLKPTTPDSLVTWDVSRHARRDQERIRSAASRIHAATLGPR